MKVKTSVSLSEELITALDILRGDHTSRSDLIETILHTYVLQRQRDERDERDLAILNANTDRFNTESADFEELQAW